MAGSSQDQNDELIDTGSVCEVKEEVLSELSESDSSESEISFDDADSNEGFGPRLTVKNQALYSGRNKLKWSSESVLPREIPVRIIQSEPPGLRGPVRSFGDHADPLQVWRCLFSDDMMIQVITSTNWRLSKVRDNYAQKRKTDLTDVDEIEFRAFLGLLYYTAILKTTHEDLDSLFATDGTGREIYRCTMSLKRLLNILLCLTFSCAEETTISNEDNSSTWLFDLIVQHSQMSYCIGEFACVDRMLVHYGGRCKESVAARDKSRKRGVKVFALCDVRTGYFLNGYVYTGRSSHGQGLDLEERRCNDRTQAVLRLTQPIVGSHRTVTAGKWFGSMEVVDELAKRDLTYVGSLRKTLKEIPPEFLHSKGRIPGTTRYGFRETATMLSYVTDRRKTVVLVSSAHRTEETDQTTGKPKIVAFHDSTKGAVGATEQNCAAFSTYNRRASRLTTAVFYAALNVAAMNAYVLYSSFANNPTTSRYNFVKGLARELIEPHLKRRIMLKSLPREIRTSITRILGEPMMHVPAPMDDRGKTLKRRRCQLCPSAHDKKTSTQCLVCFRAMCGECRYMLCKECGTEFQ